MKNIFNDLGYEGGAGAERASGLLPSYLFGDTSATALASVPVLQPGNKGRNIRSGYLLTPPRTFGIELQYRF